MLEQCGATLPALPSITTARHMSVAMRAHVTQEQVLELEMAHLDGPTALGIFRGCVVYVDLYATIGAKHTELPFCGLTMLAAQVRSCSQAQALSILQIEFHGGAVTDTVDSSTTHVVLDPADSSRLPAIRAINRRRRKLVHVVSSAWAAACIAGGRQCDEAVFHM